MGIEVVAKSSLGILENIFHNAKVGMAVCNGENHILEMVNPAFTTIYGYESSELIGVSSSKLFTTECMMRLATLEDTQDELSFEAVHSKKDGTPVNVSVHITVLKDEDGVVQQRIANIIDITKQIQAKHQLEETQAKLTSIISTIPDMIWMKDTNGFYVACNDALEQFFGTKEDELIGKTDYDFFPKENADLCKLSDNEALQSNKMSITAESFLYPEDGKTGVLEIRKVPVLKDDGEIMGVLGIGRDITEQKQMESEILKQKDFQDTLLLGTAEAGIGIHVIENGRYVYTNDIEKAKKYGYDESIFDVKPNFLDTIHPDDRAKALDMYTRRMAGEDVQNSYELGVLQTDGIRKEHSVSVVPIPHTNPVQTIVVTQDITERKRQEERLNKTKAKLAAVITTIPDLIWVKDINGIYLMCNPAFERFFGAPCEEILGKTDYDFIQKEQADFFRQKDKEALEAGEMCINEEEIVFADNGQYALLETRKMPIYFNGEFMGVLGIGRNITERKQMEKTLYESNERYSLILENSRDVMYLIEVTQDGRFIHIEINQAYVDVTGIPKSEIIGKYVDEFENEGFKDILLRKYGSCLSAGVKTEFTGEYHLLDGVKIFHSILNPIWDESGRITHIMGVARDITEQKRMEEALQSNRNLLSAILESSPELITFALDTNYQYIAFDSKHTQIIKTMFGIDIAIGMNMLDVITLDTDRTIAKESFDRALRGESFIVDEEYGDERLSRKYWQIFYSPIVSESGEVIGLTCFNIEITVRKEMELELKAREEALSSLANNIPDNIARFDSTGCYLYINSTHEQTLGMKLCEIIGKHYTEIIPSHSDVSNALEQILKREQNEITVIQEFSNQNGEVKTHEIKLLAEKNEKEELISILGIGRDITERKRLEEKVAHNENRLNEAQKIAKVGSWEVEFPSLNLHWSDEVYRIFELNVDELEPSYEYFLNVIHPDDRELVGSIYNQSVQTHTPYDVVHRLLMKDGRVKYVQERGETIYDKDGTPLKSIGTVQDISEKMRIDKELQLQSEQLFKSEKMAAMGEMIENIAHQWRQPLSVISVMTSGIAIKKELGMLKDEELLSYTERILIQTEYLSKTIDDFRNFMKGEKEEKGLNISSLFAKTLSIVDSSLKSHYIKLITHIDATLEIRGYENELMQAFINIINNAKDALVENETLEEKYIFIEAKSYDNQYEISIKDNGGGIPSSVINRIFEPYFTTKHKSQGTGLGLSMTYKIITEVHKGTITVSNETYEYSGEEYTGASFTIRFL
jgi:PAS domain S-box-containing protein